LARVSYLGSTRAKAPPKPKTGQYLSGKLTNFPPGLTDPQAQNLTLAIAGNAQGNVDRLVLDRSAVGIPDLHP
jgi:hypothetical protein